MMAKFAVWTWYSDAPQGGFLFSGNPNREMPPFHLGGVEELLRGGRLVWEFTRSMLKMDVRVLEWNERFPEMRVKPKLIVIEMRLADAATRSRRKKMEGAKMEGGVYVK